MANEHKGLKVISMKEYLETQGLAGKLRNAVSFRVSNAFEIPVELDDFIVNLTIVCWSCSILDNR